MGYSIRGPKLTVFFWLMRTKKGSSRSALQESLKDALLEGGEEQEGRGVGGAVVVPKGCLAVYVGPEMRRFVIPTSYLCRPAFRALMEKVAEEFGFEQTGGLRIPCEEEDFEEMIRVLEASASSSERSAKTKKKTKILIS